VRIADDLILDTLQIFEKEGVVAWRGIVWILPWRLTIVAHIYTRSEWRLSISARESTLNAM
jgi:hypothetical protein